MSPPGQTGNIIFRVAYVDLKIKKNPIPDMTCIFSPHNVQ